MLKNKVMKISEKSLNNLSDIGVYKITNIKNGKIYVGSTRKSFYSRYKSHLSKLRTNNHKGYPHLQNAVNKYGIKNFEFSIIEICKKEDCINREGYWIRVLHSCDREIGYNINPNPNEPAAKQKEVREKISNTLKRKYERGLIPHNSGEFVKGQSPWNKGKKYQSTDHLKIPKKVRGDRSNFTKTMELKEKPIIVKKSDGEVLGTFVNFRILSEYCKQKSNIIKDNMILRNYNGRNGYDPYYISRSNVRKSCKTGKLYKGLLFEYVKVHPKSDELLEKPEEVNQQPR